MASSFLRLAREGAVQVHQVQAPRALVDPVAGHCGGIFAEDGGLVHVTLFQAHTVAVFEVNRGNQ